LDRSILVAAVPLPRFLHDPAAGVVVAFWLVLLMACGYAYAQSAWGAQRARLLWFVAPVLLVPWSVPILAVRWL